MRKFYITILFVTLMANTGYALPLELSDVLKEAIALQRLQNPDETPVNSTVNNEEVLKNSSCSDITENDKKLKDCSSENEKTQKEVKNSK